MSNKSPDHALEATLLRLATPTMSPRDLLKETRRLHPDASRKEIVRAAFASIIAVSHRDIDKALALQDFALRERAGDNAS